MKTIVLCFGNERVCDDGIAAKVGQLLARVPLPADVSVLTVQSVHVRLLDELAGAQRLVLVDALTAGGPPGTCVTSFVTEIPSTLASAACAHTISVCHVIEMARHVGCGGDLQEVMVAGVVGAQFMTCGSGFSAEVLAAVPRLADQVLLAVGAAVEARAMVRDLGRGIIPIRGHLVHPDATLDVPADALAS